MDNIQKADKSGSIIWNGDTSSVMDQFIHSSWAKGGLDNIDDGLASVDVWNDLTSAFSFFSTFFKNYDLWSL